MYNTETYKQPFWAENSGFMTGRDPLGIQNSSITVYAALLPGMTNLTLRLRYYGLYCWLLNEYDKLDLDSEEKTLQHHYNYIRRTELTIAFLMQSMDPKVTSIVGSDFAGNHLHEFKEKGSYNVSEGADKTKSTKKGTVYWDYISGALGQYYAGSLMALELIETSNKFFLIREKGKELSLVFDNNIKKPARETFLSILENGILSRNDIDVLRDFEVTKIPKGSEEWQYYKSLLLQNDGKNSKTSDNSVPSNRKETIKLYLNFIKESKIDWFPEQQYENVKAGDFKSDSSFGWYYYYINEAIHYCVETIFWGMLVELDGKSIPIHKFISEIVNIIIQEIPHDFRKINDQNLLDEVINSLYIPDLSESLSQLESLTKSTQNANKAMSFAFILFLQIYKISKEKLDQIREFENKYYLNFQKGRVTEFIDLFIVDHLEYPFNNFIEVIIKNIINDHISTAYRKMGNGESNLLKFVIEDGMIGHIQTMSPRFTTPRLRTLNNFLTDLGFINNSGKISELGEQLITEIF